MRLKVKRKGLIIAVAVPALLFLIFVFLDLIFPLPGVEKDYSIVVYSRNNEIIHGFLNKNDKWRVRADFDEISPEIRKAIVFKEDRYFYFHPGINPVSVVRAAFNNLTKGRRTSGASTITMQLARLTEPAPRTLKSKIKEAFRALQYELHYSKKEILAMYMNLLPYGGNVEGINTAAMFYFGQKPGELSPAQIVTLSVIPNNPNYLNPRNAGNLSLERNRWLKRFYEKGVFSREEYEDALNEEVLFDKYPVPRKAPHLSRLLFRRNGGVTDRIYSTVDLKFQDIAETTLGNYIRYLRTMGITNGSVVIVDNHTHEVRAYVGSAGFDENEYSGQVDGVRALRSPGSALKPALYMMAFDKGVVSPKTMVNDVPVNFGGYRPENYDESYRGKVSIEQALALSLNIPAVELLDQTGLYDMHSLLSRAGFKWIAKNKKNVGLSLILGGCGATLEELTALYSGFANRGMWYPLRYTTEEGKNDKPVMISSPGSAYMLTQILTGLKRPDLPSDYLESAKLPMIAWKTGTSYGRRDAWAIGYNADYTVGVWTGNFDGRGAVELNGADCAVPILFSVFNQISSREAEWFFPSGDTDFRLVCQETGMVPDTFCHNTVMETFLPGISPSVRCNHLKPVFTNETETVSYCSDCLPEKGYKKVLYPNYSPALVNYFEERNIPYKKIPDHNEECTTYETDNGPVITSLTAGAEYLVLAGRKQRLALKCTADNGVKTIYWYIDQKLYKQAAPTETVYFEAEKGEHKITCADDRGRTTEMGIKVVVI
jgi:penicillin-binding protein 1C